MSVDFFPAIPTPYATDWRKAYRFDDSDLPRLSSYQAPGGKPVAFIQKDNKLSGGHSGEAIEIPFYGFWINNTLNEKPHGITINGFLRGADYIKNRNDLVSALQTPTSDDNCGYLDLPSWGRFPVVIYDWDVVEDSEKLGQCSISITFVRAGLSENGRIETFSNVIDIDIISAADEMKNASVENFVNEIEKNLDRELLSSAFDEFKTKLLDIVGSAQGAIATLNKMADGVSQISSLIARGIRIPRDMALAAFSAVSTIVAGIAEIAEAAESYGTLFSGNRNTEKALFNLFSAESFSLPDEANTAAQQVTKAAAENLWRTCAYFGAAQLLPSLDVTHERQLAFWKLFMRLENVISLEDSNMYAAVESLRMSVANQMTARNADRQLVVKIKTDTPLLPLSHHLGCDGAKIRELNTIYDSFRIHGDVIYV